jgi:DNA-binding transcriptional ArsR family regulator
VRGSPAFVYSCIFKYLQGNQIASLVGISRPLLHLHLQRLEEVGLVTSKLELSQDGNALNYFEVRNFDFELTPASIAQAAKSLASKSES